MQSEDDLNYDMDLEKQNMQQQKFHSNTYRSSAGGGVLSQQSAGYCQSLYSTSIAPKFDHNEPLYGGTRSLYCKSPPLTRANLNRSQSVYAKSQTAINRDFPRPGPLVPAQSLYPMRVSTQNSHLQNQNVQNQLQQRSESIYGIRGSMKQERQPQDSQAFQPVYGTRTVTTASIGDGLCKYDRDPREMRDDGTAVKFSNRGHRPESMYGVTGGQRRGQSTQSDDSSYGSYHGPPPSVTPPTRNQNGHAINGDAMNPGYQQSKGGPNQPERKTSTSGSERQGYNGKPPSSGSSMSHPYSMQQMQMVRQT
ncbi:hypothetical protein HA402_009333 [Bradysia odoriphaga]|nr:hypothetical protein HA402_009333 [Bradysia odoriphaga]